MKKQVNEDLIKFLLAELDRIRKINEKIHEVTLNFKNSKYNSSHYSYGGVKK